MNLRFLTFRWRPVLVIVSLFGLLLGAWSVEWVNNDSGYLMLAYGQYSVETNLLIGFAVLLVVAFVVYGGVQIAVWLAGVGQRQRKRANKQLSKAASALVMNDFKQAEQVLLQAASRLPKPMGPLMLAAYCAQEQGEFDRRDSHLMDMAARVPRRKVEIELARARLAFVAKDWESCIALLETMTLKGRHPGSRIRSQLLAESYANMGDYERALQELIASDKHRWLDDGALSQLKVQWLVAWLKQQCSRTVAEGEGKKEQLAKVKRLLKSFSDAERLDVSLVVALAEFYVHTGDSGRANELVWDGLKQQFAIEWIQAYRHLPSESPRLRLERALTLSKRHEDYPEVLALLGQAYLDASDHTRAKDALERSLELAFDPIVIKQLANCLVGLGDVEGAVALWQHPMWSKNTGAPN